MFRRVRPFDFHRLNSARAASLLLCVMLAACSRSPSRAERAAAEEARLAGPPVAGAVGVPVDPIPVREPVEPAASVEAPASPQGPAPAPPDPVAEAAEQRRMTEDLYRGVRQDIPEKDRREAARVMAEDLMKLGRESQESNERYGLEEARRAIELDRQRQEILKRRCVDARAELDSLEAIARDGPRERMSAESLAAIPGEIAKRRAALPTLCG